MLNDSKFRPDLYYTLPAAITTNLNRTFKFQLNLRFFIFALTEGGCASKMLVSIQMIWQVHSWPAISM